MTQKTSIFSFLLKNPNSRPFEIAQALNMKAPSVRRAIFELRSDKILTAKKLRDPTVKIRNTKQSRDFKEFVIEYLKKVKPKEPRKKKKKEPKPIILYFTKILKTGGSNKHDKKIVASTYENQESPERFQELKKAIMEFANLYRLQTRDLGYQRKKVKNQPVKIPEFPKIEVHTEF